MVCGSMAVLAADPAAGIWHAEEVGHKAGVVPHNDTLRRVRTTGHAAHRAADGDVATDLAAGVADRGARNAGHRPLVVEAGGSAVRVLATSTETADGAG